MQSFKTKADGSKEYILGWSNPSLFQPDNDKLMHPDQLVNKIHYFHILFLGFEKTEVVIYIFPFIRLPCMILARDNRVPHDQI